MFQLKLVSPASRWIEGIQREFVDCPRVLAICGSWKEIPSANAIFASTFECVEAKQGVWLPVPFIEEYTFFSQVLRSMKTHLDKGRTLVIAFHGTEEISLLRKAYDDFMSEQETLARINHLENHARY